jgi:hypothetical protein
MEVVGVPLPSIITQVSTNFLLLYMLVWSLCLARCMELEKRK